MHGQPIAIQMAAESTRRHLSEPVRERRPHAPRRAVARVLQAAAHRLDASVTRAPRAAAG
jgi:hypothetical protein